MRGYARCTPGRLWGADVEEEEEGVFTRAEVRWGECDRTVEGGLRLPGIQGPFRFPRPWSCSRHRLHFRWGRPCHLPPWPPCPPPCLPTRPPGPQPPHSSSPPAFPRAAPPAHSQLSQKTWDTVRVTRDLTRLPLRRLSGFP